MDNQITSALDAVKYRIRQAIVESMTELGGAIVDEVRENIGVPVGVTRGARGGRVIIRSKPGEFPRLETGDLQKSIANNTEASGAGPIVTAIYTASDYAVPLEKKSPAAGGRPFMQPAKDEWEGKTLQTVADLVKSKLSL